MKKSTVLLALWMTLLLAIAAPARASDITGLLEGFGITGPQAEAFATIVSQLGEDVTEEDIQALLAEYAAADGRPTGTLAGDLYTYPEAFSCKVPEGWTVLENPLGVTAMFMGAVDERGFAPTISVMVLSGVAPDFDTATKETWDAYLGESLTNYQGVAFDGFDFLDVPAHELVFSHGTDPEAMLMQYQLYFNKDARAFILTMTALADEAVHEAALTAYDAFLDSFLVIESEGVG